MRYMKINRESKFLRDIREKDNKERVFYLGKVAIVKKPEKEKKPSFAEEVRKLTEILTEGVR